MVIKHWVHWLLGLTIGPLVLSTATAASSSQFLEGQLYVVQAEDGLDRLAEKYYDDAALSWVIAQATNAKAKEDHTFAAFEPPLHLKIGQKLWIPSAETLEEPTLTSPIPLLSQVAELAMPADTLIFSPDDKLLVLNGWASSGEPRIVQVWDTETWTLRWETNPDDWAKAVAFNPNGQQLSVNFSDTTYLSETATGKLLVQLQYKGEAVYNVVFSPTGQQMVGASSAGKITLWNATTNQPMVEFKHDLPISHFVLSPEGPWLAVMAADAWGPVELVVWDIVTHERRVLTELEGPPNYSNVIFSPDTTWLAAAIGYDSPVTIWETQTWPEVAQLERPPGAIQQLVFSPDGRWLAGLVANGETGNKIVIWAVPAWQVAAQMNTVNDQVIMFSPNSQWLVTGGIGYEAELWEVATGKLVAQMPHEGQVPGVTFSHNGQWIATGSVDRTVRIWAVPR